jgi:hypothetical protein
MSRWRKDDKKRPYDVPTIVDVIPLPPDEAVTVIPRVTPGTETVHSPTIPGAGTATADLPSLPLDATTEVPIPNETYIEPLPGADTVDLPRLSLDETGEHPAAGYATAETEMDIDLLPDAEGDGETGEISIEFGPGDQRPEDSDEDTDEDLEASCDLPSGPVDANVVSSLEELSQTGESPVRIVGSPLTKPAPRIQPIGGEPGSARDDDTATFQADPFGEDQAAITTESPIPTAAKAGELVTGRRPIATPRTYNVTVDEIKYDVPYQIQTLNGNGLQSIADAAGTETSSMFSELEKLADASIKTSILDLAVASYTKMIPVLGVGYTIGLSRLIDVYFFKDRAIKSDTWLEEKLDLLSSVEETDAKSAGKKLREFRADLFLGYVQEDYGRHLASGAAVVTKAPTVTTTTVGKPSPAADAPSEYAKATKPKKRRGLLATIGCGFLTAALLCTGGLVGLSKYLSNPLREYEDLTVTPYTRTEQELTADDDTTPTQKVSKVIAGGSEVDVTSVYPQEATTEEPTPEEPTLTFDDYVSELEQVLREGANLKITDSKSDRGSWITYKGEKLIVVRTGIPGEGEYNSLAEAIEGESHAVGVFDRGETDITYNLNLGDKVVGPTFVEGTDITVIVYNIVNEIPTDAIAEETGDDDNATDESVTTLRYGEGDPDAAAEILKDLATTTTEPGVFNGYEPGFDFAKRSTQEYKDLISNHAATSFFVDENERVDNALNADISDVFFKRGAEDTTMSAYFYCTGPDGNPHTEKIIFSFTDTESGHRFDYHVFQDGRTRETITDQDGNRTDKRDEDITRQHYAAIFQYFVNTTEVLDNVPIPDAPIE